MNYKKLTFEEIMQDKILYYDKEVESACYNICYTLKIDNMPGYDSNYYYELVDNKFVKKHTLVAERLDCKVGRLCEKH